MAKLTEKVYGEALFELAVEEGREKELLQEVLTIRKVLDKNPDFAKLMKNPAIPESEKEEVLKTVWDGCISKEITGLMLLLLQRSITVRSRRCWITLRPASRKSRRLAWRMCPRRCPSRKNSKKRRKETARHYGIQVL